MLGSNVKIDDLITAISERKLRFKDRGGQNPANHQSPNERLFSKTNLFFNELFEMGQLDFMSFQKKLDSIAKEEFYGDREFKSDSEKVQDSFVQQECFRRIREFLDTSEKIVCRWLRMVEALLTHWIP